ncbi:hypothetical protein B0J17DRAFT_713783 [Rhizoctonia solani]|nr:hypothetical protein B0J17DRAFT_713783 [Rhizoctonia solani]
MSTRCILHHAACEHPSRRRWETFILGKRARWSTHPSNWNRAQWDEALLMMGTCSVMATVVMVDGVLPLAEGESEVSAMVGKGPVISCGARSGPVTTIEALGTCEIDDGVIGERG